MTSLADAAAVPPSAEGGASEAGTAVRPVLLLPAVGGLLCTLALLAALLSWTAPADWARTAAALASPLALWLVLGLVASHLLRAARLHAEWQGRTGAGYRECLALFLIHNAAVCWLPLRSGEAGYLLWLKRRWQVPVGPALSSLLWLRLQDALVLALISAALLLALAGRLPVEAALLAAAVTAVLGAAAVMRLHRLTAAGLGAGSASAGPPTVGAGRLAARLRRAGMQATRTLASGRGGWRAWAWCIANWLVKLTTLGAALAQAAALPSATGLGAAVAGEWAGVLPLQGPGGLGSYEAAVWLGVQALPGGAADLAPGRVLQATLLVHGLSLAVASIGAALALAAGAWRRPQERCERRERWTMDDGKEMRPWT